MPSRIWGDLAMRTGLLAALVLIPCLAGCASSMSGPSASLQAAPDHVVPAQRSTRTATVKKRAPTRAVARASAAEPFDAQPQAPAQAEPPIGTIGLSPVEAARANASAAIEAERREDERMRRIMTICTGCGMTPGNR